MICILWTSKIVMTLRAKQNKQKTKLHKILLITESLKHSDTNISVFCIPNPNKRQLSLCTDGLKYHIKCKKLLFLYIEL